MFIRQQHILVARGPASLNRSRAVRAALSLAALGLHSSSCALEVRDGDGLVSDGREISVSASSVPDAGQGSVEPSSDVDLVPIPCKALPLYQAHVAPLFLTKFNSSTEVETKACIDCHDGSKPKAGQKLAMMRNRDLDEVMCSLTLTLGAKKPDKLQAEILISSDPSRLDFVHDFKFKTMDEYVRYRDEILIWLSAEK
jgi:hypothetical protein